VAPVEERLQEIEQAGFEIAQAIEYARTLHGCKRVRVRLRTRSLASKLWKKSLMLKT
jgi:hypothetical protein